MSANEESNELKAGHPPAVKVGGMRITQHKPAHDKTQEARTNESKDEDKEEEGEVVASVSPPKPQLVISGALAKGDADFPPEAIKAFHEKPMPSHEYRPNVNKVNQIIHQPRK
ncbi:death-associated protein-like protein [Dinothrombium tinctorium]|uniref:Death-associated protein-like protein n=1 Tax=Dinothrombium tinctorium TaxID=1965070 RepID=A0A3S3QHW2_9ACAR|nr:death-associated protein-like protein [Dinothrombium tinctorium]